MAIESIGRVRVRVRECIPTRKQLFTIYDLKVEILEPPNNPSYRNPYYRVGAILEATATNYLGFEPIVGEELDARLAMRVSDGLHVISSAKRMRPDESV